MNFKIIFLLISLLMVAPIYADNWNVDRIGTIQHWSAEGMDSFENTVAVAAGSMGLHILDLDDPSRIYEAGVLRIPGVALSVVLDGNQFAYIAAGWAGLEIVDISDPFFPTEVSYFDEIPGIAVDVAISGEIACLAMGDGGIAVINIEDVESPELITMIETDQPVTTVALMDEILVASGEQFETTFYDLINPFEPEDINGINNNFIEIKISGSKLFGCSAWGLFCIDISDLESIVQTDSMRINQPSQIALTFQGDQALVAGRDGWSLIEIDEEGNLTLLYSDPSQRTSRGVGFVNEVAVILPSAGLEAYNIDNPGSPERVGMACNIGRILGVEKVGDFAVSLGGLMSVIDMSDPRRPIVLSITTIPGSADPLKILGPLVYIPCEDLRVYDLSDPRNPELLGTHEPGGRDVDVEGDIAALINQDNLFMVDVSDPSDMQTIGHYHTANNIFFRNLDLVGNLIYTATSNGIQVFDASEPRNLERISVLESSGGSFSDVLVEGEIAYAIGGSYQANQNALFIIDVGDPQNSVELSSIDLPAYPRGLAKAGDWIYVADNWAGLQVIDVSDPEDPVSIGYWTEEGDNYIGASAFDDFVMTADRYKGLSIFQNTYVADEQSVDPVYSPETFKLSSFPNPFNASIQIQAMLPTPGYWSMKVYGANGAEVADIGSGWKNAGAFTTSFDALMTPAGNYFLRVEGNGVSTIKRLVLIK